MLSPTAQLLQPEIAELARSQSHRELRASLKSLNPADIAQVLGDLLDTDGPELAALAYRVLPRDDAGEVFAHLGSEEQEALIEQLGDERAVRVIEAMDPDDRAAVLDELPVEVARRIIASLRPQARRQTQAILGYDAESVGRLMTPDYVRVRPGWTVAEALTHVRKHGRDAETLHWIYVVDEEGKLIDDITIRSLLLADPDGFVESLMDERYAALAATDDREEAVRVMARYDRSALPVVDGRGLLLGIVTHDDVADVAEAEATEDIHLLGGLEALDQPYLNTGPMAMIRKRGVVLAVLFVMQLLTIAVMSRFDEQLAKAVVLALFVPLIISSGGNTGTQAASLLVREIALEQVSLRDWARVTLNELRTGLVLGSLLGLMGMLTVVLADAAGLAPTDHAWRVGFVVGTAVVGIVMWGGLAGSLLPLALSKIGIDPAASSGPLVATIMDVSGLTIYFTIAVLLLSGTLL